MRELTEPTRGSIEVAKRVVYLSGGMEQGWRTQVVKAVPGCSYIDPCSHGLSLPAEYTTWDLMGVRRCDILFAYFEATNPSGIGMAAEIGYAKALGKTIIFVDAHGGWTHILREMADVWYIELQGGIRMLDALVSRGRLACRASEA